MMIARIRIPIICDFFKVRPLSVSGDGKITVYLYYIINDLICLVDVEVRGISGINAEIHEGNHFVVGEHVGGMKLSI